MNGERIDNLSHEAMRRVRGKKIGAIFQDPLTSLHPMLSIGAQLAETIRTHFPVDAAAARATALELLKAVGIPAAETRIDHYPHQFSGGMRQRVVIALALAGKPALIVADEPTTALDVSIQAQITSLLKRLCRDYGTSVMLITHDMGVIAETADRVAVMYAGRIVETGPVESVTRAPRHPYTRGLMASIPSMRTRQATLQQIDGAMPRLNAIPEGCAFNLRCARASAQCRAEKPVLEVQSHAIACWHPFEGVAHG
jgi:peptide/nickel transport system ATP-binding protein